MLDQGSATYCSQAARQAKSSGPQPLYQNVETVWPA